jgi:hypothetical protein
VARRGMKSCESELPDGRKCTGTAIFLVGIGTRQFDRQLSCARHLALTIITMIGAEGLTSGAQVDAGRNATIAWNPAGFPKEES